MERKKIHEKFPLRNDHDSLISDAVLEFASLLLWRIQDTEGLSNMEEELLTPPGASMALLMLSHGCSHGLHASATHGHCHLHESSVHFPF